MKNSQQLAQEFLVGITDKETKKVLFQYISDEAFEEIKKSFRAETSIRNQKRYYRYENPHTNNIEWCIESKLGTYLKSNKFKQHLKQLGCPYSKRNSHKEIYVHPEPVDKKHCLSSKELETDFINDPNGKQAQTPTLTILGQRPTKLAALQY
ncbi:hypothetical protein ACG9VV_000864 [Vibrio alginolyticus]|uniref:hypothetical protein n=1 Tax=Vibrio alginolyticus TaxID=663 RepID=UPI003749CDF0